MASSFELLSSKRIYFASDLHLGAPNTESSVEREKRFVSWLDSIAKDAQALYLVGDLFDFWFEYRHAVPKGFVRTLGKLAELHDQGVKLYFLTGNHDLWARDYLSKEVGFEVFTKPITHVWNNQRFYIGHGDGLGPGDQGYKLLKRVFTFKPFQWAFRWLHPDIGIGLASWLSRGSRARTGQADYAMKNVQDEALYQYAQVQHAIHPADYWIFGHRHYPALEDLSGGPSAAKFCNLGDWIQWNSWAVFDGEHLELHRGFGQ
jgi:UDP-2,3-diacylglucosamine hydrolase